MTAEKNERTQSPLPEAHHPQRTLWMLECWNGSYHQLIPLCALSEEDANNLAEKHIRTSNKRLERINLQAFPDGFVIHHSRLPGKV